MPCSKLWWNRLFQHSDAWIGSGWLRMLAGAVGCSVMATWKGRRSQEWLPYNGLGCVAPTAQKSDEKGLAHGDVRLWRPERPPQARMPALPGGGWRFRFCLRRTKAVTADFSLVLQVGHRLQPGFASGSRAVELYILCVL